MIYSVWCEAEGIVMRVLMIGDVVGKPGRQVVDSLLPEIRDSFGIDLVIANGENVAGGAGITLDTADELLASGVDVITSGNHIWDQKSIIPHLDNGLPILRPLNYPPSAPGRGHIQVAGVLIVNLIGRLFVGTFDCPFRTVTDLIGQIGLSQMPILIDMHAEATSEKVAMAWYLDGRVSVVAGTHTHVPTADARILPNGTGFVSDLGMSGPYNSVIGVNSKDAINRFLTQTPQRFKVAENGPSVFNSVLFDIDDHSGLTTSIQRVDRVVD